MARRLLEKIQTFVRFLTFCALFDTFGCDLKVSDVLGRFSEFPGVVSVVGFDPGFVLALSKICLSVRMRNTSQLPLSIVRTRFP